MPTEPPVSRAIAKIQNPFAHWDRWVWLFLIVGSLLRLIWPLDMEWKFDEKWMFEQGLAIAQGRAPWPWLGMPSGVGLRNPGLSIWPFALLGYVADTPVAMTHTIAWINTLGLWALVLWVQRSWPKEQRALGLWGIALYAVTPLAVLFSRKLWAQDLLILLVVPWLWGHSKRQSVGGAFLWGCFGALLGQIHMSGFFAAAGLLIVTLLQDRLRFHVWAWLAGSVLGSLTLVPWLQYLLSPEARAVSQPAGEWSLRFFVEALRHAWGLGLEYPLERAYHALLRGPVIAGVQTHLAQAARYGLLSLLLWAVVARALDGKVFFKKLPSLIYTYGGCVLITGLLMFVARVHVYEHYLIVFGPMLHIVAAWLLFKRRAAVIAACVLQASLTVCFLVYIHEHGGVPDADYGKTYRVQTAEERKLTLPPK